MGLVAYEMVCGRGPFDEFRGVTVADAHLRRAPPPLSTFGQNVPEELEALMVCWLAKDASKRPPSAALLARRLREMKRRLDAGGRKDADTEPTPLENMRFEREGDGRSAEIVTNPQAPGPKRTATEAGSGTTERDVMPMGGARTLVPDSPPEKTLPSGSSREAVDRAAVTSTRRPNTPPRPRLASDTVELPLEAVGHPIPADNVRVGPNEPVANVVTPLPAAGARASTEH
jgi:hypothetical protein